MSAAAPSPARNGKKPERYTAPTELMNAMGSQTGSWDPMPPNQYLWIFENSTCALDRLVAFLWLHTIGRHHRTPYATTEQGKALWLQDVAAGLDWEERTARNYLNTAARSGLLRIEHKAKRIYVNAEIVPQEIEEEEETEGRKEGEDFDCVLRCLGPDVVEFIQNLPPDQRTAAVKRCARYAAWRNKVMADTVAAFRSVAQPIEDSLLASLGYYKQRLATRREPPQSVKIEVLALPDLDSVQSHDELVCTNTSASLYSAKADSAQSNASLLGLDITVEGSVASSSSPLPGDEGAKTQPATAAAGTPAATATPVENHKDPGTRGAMAEPAFCAALSELVTSSSGINMAPSRKETRGVYKILPPDGREAWLQEAATRAKDWRKTGVLVEDARRFAAAWPSKQKLFEQREQAAVAAQERWKREEEWSRWEGRYADWLAQRIDIGIANATPEELRAARKAASGVPRWGYLSAFERERTVQNYLAAHIRERLPVFAEWVAAKKNAGSSIAGSGENGSHS